MAKKPTKAGKIKLVVADKSGHHNFHLTGPGVNVKTSVGATGTKTFTVTLKKGTYKFVCDPHASFMKGSFKISSGGASGRVVARPEHGPSVGTPASLGSCPPRHIGAPTPLRGTGRGQASGSASIVPSTIRQAASSSVRTV